MTTPPPPPPPPGPPPLEVSAANIRNQDIDGWTIDVWSLIPSPFLFGEVSVQSANGEAIAEADGEFDGAIVSVQVSLDRVTWRTAKKVDGSDAIFAGPDVIEVRANWPFMRFHADGGGVQQSITATLARLSYV